MCSGWVVYLFIAQAEQQKPIRKQAINLIKQLRRMGSIHNGYGAGKLCERWLASSDKCPELSPNICVANLVPFSNILRVSKLDLWFEEKLNR